MQVVDHPSRNRTLADSYFVADSNGTVFLDPLTSREPEREAVRLAALHRYAVVGTAAEAIFNGLAAMASDLFDTPIAFVTLVDERRSWLKAQVGLRDGPAHCDGSFCRQVILQPDEIMVVPDALADPRFASAPMVTGNPHIRFYAGAPLRSRAGHALGTLAVASTIARPGGLSTKEERQLRALSTSIMDALDLRRQGLVAKRGEKVAQAHRTREERLRLALKAAGACAWELDPATSMTTWDTSALSLFGVPSSAELHEALALYVHPLDLASVLAGIESSLDPEGAGLFVAEHRAKSDEVGGDATGSPAGARWFQSQGQAWFEGEGEARRAVRLVCITLDITERHAAAERQGLLIAELNHRVKNTLSIVQSIAEQTRRSTGGAKGAHHRALGIPERRQFHGDFNARLKALAAAHDTLTREAWRGAALDELVRDLVAPYANGVAAALPPPGCNRVIVAGPSTWLASNTALALALVVHELATNAAKHGALSSPEGQVSVEWGTDAASQAVWFTWAETGGPHVSGPPTRAGFGTRLIDLTVRRQLGGSLAWNWGTGGLAVRFTVPAARALASK